MVTERQLKNAQLRWEEDKIGIEGEDVALGNEVKDTVKVFLDTLKKGTRHHGFHQGKFVGDL